MTEEWENTTERKQKAGYNFFNFVTEQYGRVLYTVEKDHHLRWDKLNAVGEC